MLYPKYFCRIEKSKLAFDLTFAGYKNEKENIHFTPVKQEVIEIADNDNYSSVIAEQQQQQQQENTTAASSKQQQLQQRKREVKKRMKQHLLQRYQHGRRNVTKRKRSL